MSRILFATIGSLGDLHPLVAIALELQRRGHAIRFCTSEGYRNRLEPLGFGFHPLRPDSAPNDEKVSARIKDIFDPKRGPERLLRSWIFPELRSTYEDLMEAVFGHKETQGNRNASDDRTADLLVTGELVYPAPLISEKFNLPWASCITAPISFFSSHDLPILPPAQRLSRWLRQFGPGVNRWTIRTIKLATSKWSAPVEEFRGELGLPPGADPIYHGKFSPRLTLAMFSSAFAEAQPDWPANTVVTGFPFYDGVSQTHGLPPELGKFLKAGEPPVVFTLGSSAVFDARDFYEQSAAAAALLGRRAVLLTGSNIPTIRRDKNILCCEYARFSELFPHACAVVHQGGIGTTAQALRAGCPMLVMPFGFDQPDNAARIERLGLGRSISRTRYSAERVARCLEDLITSPKYRQAASRISASLRDENGAATAADALENLLQS